MEISDDLNSQINEGMTISELCKADVIRQALRIGLPQLAARFQRPPCGWRSGFVKLLLNAPNQRLWSNLKRA